MQRQYIDASAVRQAGEEKQQADPQGDDCSQSEAAQLVSCLFDPSDLVEFRFIHPVPGRSPGQVWCTADNLADLEPLLAEKNGKGYGIYFGANPRTGHGGTADDVALARALVADFDGVPLDGARRRCIDGGLPEPTAIVSTGGGFHFWWRLSEPITDLDRYTQLQRGIIRATESDNCIHDPPRVMRAPGFVNTKPNRNGAMASIVECHPDRTCSIQMFPTSTSRPAKPQDNQESAHPGQIGELSRDTLGVLANVAALHKGNRNNRLFKAAADMAGCGSAFDEIHTRLAPIFQEAGLTDPEIKKTIMSACSKSRKPSRAQANSETSVQNGRRDSQATILVELARPATLFHDSENEAWATIPVGKHEETCRITDKRFRSWLQCQFFHANHKACGSQAMQDAIATISASACFDGPTHAVHIRVAGHDGKIYLDLADDQWRVVEIDEHGWQVLSASPVKFWRPKGMKPLPLPAMGGSIDELREYVNVRDDDAFILLVAFLLATLRPQGAHPVPYPILSVAGEQGSAKSTMCQLVRSLIDPNQSPLRSKPRDIRDLAIAARNGWMIGLDNLSHLPTWLSDAFCRLSTGGGFATRALYCDLEEVTIDARRPIILNGIEAVGTRSDLLDRQICLVLEPIAEADRTTERKFWSRFNEARPRILGALLSAVSAGLRNIGSITLKQYPRMADFAEWMVACERGLPWEPGTFICAYSRNRAETDELAIEGSAIGPTLLRFVRSVGSWSGIASELSQQLTGLAGDAAKHKSWPAGPTALSQAVKRLATNLRRIGIHVRFVKTGSRREIRFSCCEVGANKADRDDKRDDTRTLPPSPMNDTGDPEKPKHGNRDDRDADSHAHSSAIHSTSRLGAPVTLMGSDAVDAQPLFNPANPVPARSAT